MMELNIIGDIAGNYLTLMRLLEKMPSCNILSVGDLCDRGVRSKEVIEWFMTHPQNQSLRGNHEHMLVDYCRRSGLYERGIWEFNGGSKTLASFGLKVPDEVVDWISKLPLFVDDPDTGLFVSHSFAYLADVPGACRELWHDYSILWNREEPVRMAGRFQIAGHNSQWGLRSFSDGQGEFALGIDTSKEKVLTGLHWPSRTIYQQPVID